MINQTTTYFFHSDDGSLTKEFLCVFWRWDGLRMVRVLASQVANRWWKDDNWRQNIDLCIRCSIQHCHTTYECIDNNAILYFIPLQNMWNIKPLILVILMFHDIIQVQIHLSYLHNSYNIFHFYWNIFYCYMYILSLSLVLCRGKLFIVRFYTT